MDPDDTPPVDLDHNEWGADAAPTVIDAPEARDTTGPVPVSELPGFEPGRVQGRREGYQAGIDDCLDALRMAMMEQGTDAGTAYRTAERVARRIKKP